MLIATCHRFSFLLLFAGGYTLPIRAAGGKHHDLDHDQIDEKGVYSTMISMASPPSPSSACWKAAVTFLDETTSDGTTSSSVSSNPKEVCHAMNSVHQKLLALEIASCHLQDLGQDLFRLGGQCSQMNNRRRVSGNDEDENEDNDEDEFDNEDNDDPLYCLKELTPVGTLSYTHYIVHVQSLCLKLTQEVALQHQQNLQLNLLQQQWNHSLLAVTQWQRVHDMTRKHSEQLHQLAMMPQQLQHEWISVVLEELAQVTQDQVSTWVDEWQEQVQNRLEQVVQDHAAHQRSVMDAMTKEWMDVAKQQQLAWHEAVHSTMLQQFQSWNATSTTYQQQVLESWQVHDDRVRIMESKLKSVQRYLTWMEFGVVLFGRIWQGLSSSLWAIFLFVLWHNDEWLGLGLYTVFVNMAVWTWWTRSRRSRRTSRMRWCMLSLAILGASLECFIRSTNAKTNDALSVIGSWEIRLFTLFVQVVSYVICSLYGWLFRGNGVSEDSKMYTTMTTNSPNSPMECEYQAPVYHYSYPFPLTYGNAENPANQSPLFVPAPPPSPSQCNNNPRGVLVGNPAYRPNTRNLEHQQDVAAFQRQFQHQFLEHLIHAQPANSLGTSAQHAPEQARIFSPPNAGAGPYEAVVNLSPSSGQAERNGIGAPSSGHDESNSVGGPPSGQAEVNRVGAPSSGQAEVNSVGAFLETPSTESESDRKRKRTLEEIEDGDEQTKRSCHLDMAEIEELHVHDNATNNTFGGQGRN